MEGILELFKEYWANEPLEVTSYLNDCMDLLHGFAQEKGIEFDGYFQERWEDAADTIVNFDEDYFENRDRKNNPHQNTAIVTGKQIGRAHV